METPTSLRIGLAVENPESTTVHGVDPLRGGAGSV
jgi:hypothetical protein